MKDRITIEGRNGEFGAHIARQKIVPAPAVVVLNEAFGVNADIRKTCDELADQGVIAVAPLMVGCLVRPTEPSGRRRRGSSHAPFRLFAVGVSTTPPTRDPVALTQPVSLRPTAGGARCCRGRESPG